MLSLESPVGRGISQRLCKALKISGPFNIQFICKELCLTRMTSQKLQEDETGWKLVKGWTHVKSTCFFFSMCPGQWGEGHWVQPEGLQIHALHLQDVQRELYWVGHAHHVRPAGLPGHHSAHGYRLRGGIISWCNIETTTYKSHQNQWLNAISQHFERMILLLCFTVLF